MPSHFDLDVIYHILILLSLQVESMTLSNDEGKRLQLSHKGSLCEI
jgi:hypothetical protein